MANRLRFKLKFKIPSFQLCCSKRLSTVPSIYRLSSPIDPKARYIGYPNLPPPPPSTPEPQCMVISPSIKSNSHLIPFNDCTTNGNSPHIVHCESTFCKMGGRDDIKDKKVVKARGPTNMPSISSMTRTCDDLLNHNKPNSNNIEEESESLFSRLNSFSDEFCHDENHEIVHFSPRNCHKPEKELNFRHGKKTSSTEKVQKKKATMMSRASKTKYSSVEGIAKESFVVVKKSNDPYEDFKNSMMEMIMEMEMFEGEELERLLQCFLALNSRCYHGVIVKAFMEIWQQLVCEACVHQKSENSTR